VFLPGFQKGSVQFRPKKAICIVARKNVKKLEKQFRWLPDGAGMTNKGRVPHWGYRGTRVPPGEAGRRVLLFLFSRNTIIVSCDKQNTALVCFLSGNITLMVFLAWKTHSTCGLVGFPGKKTTRVIFSLKKYTRAVFLFYQIVIYHYLSISVII
jgi:hypothetical protein